MGSLLLTTLLPKCRFLGHQWRCSGHVKKVSSMNLPHDVQFSALLGVKCWFGFFAIFRLWWDFDNCFWYLHVSQLSYAILPQFRVLLVAQRKPRNPIRNPVWTVPSRVSPKVQLRLPCGMYLVILCSTGGSWVWWGKEKHTALVFKCL